MVILWCNFFFLISSTQHTNPLLMSKHFHLLRNVFSSLTRVYASFEFGWTRQYLLTFIAADSSLSSPIIFVHIFLTVNWIKVNECETIASIIFNRNFCWCDYSLHNSTTTVQLYIFRRTQWHNRCCTYLNIWFRIFRHHIELHNARSLGYLNLIRISLLTFSKFGTCLKIFL